MKYIYLAISVLLFTACEDVIDLSLKEGPKRLVIDANINVNKSLSETDNPQKIRLSQTSGFYDVTIPPANEASVIITSSSDGPFEFLEEGTTGIYKITDFKPTVGEEYTLTIVYNGQTFTAKETMISVADIQSTIQTTENFFGTDVIKIEHFFEDPENEINFYINQFNYPTSLIDSYGARPDDFTNGQLNSVFDQSEEFTAGETHTLYFYGASEQYFNYFNLLLDQISSRGPFGTPPASVKGNCINKTNPDSKPLGYFRLSEMVVLPYIIKETE